MEHLGVVVTTGLACDVCGRLPHPRRTRLTLAKIAAVLPVEFLLHAMVVRLHPPFLVTVTSLAVLTSALVIWVVEPSAMRLLTGWLHAPARRHRGRIQGAPELWRLRVTVDDRSGALERLTHQLTELQANILSLHVHPVPDGVRDELVVSTPHHVRAHAILEAAEAGGGRDPHVWPTTALALVDGQTRALSLSTRVVADPGELPHAVAELLGARLVTDHLGLTGTLPNDGTVLKIPSPWTGLFAFTRPGEPFTPAESARAHRLAELAEVVELSRRSPAQLCATHC